MLVGSKNIHLCVGAKDRHYLSLKKTEFCTQNPASRVVTIHEFAAQCFHKTIFPLHSTGGVSREGKVLELFRNENVSQTFFQISCRPDRKNKPCEFVKKIPVTGGFSRCIQQYTYQYAIVRDYDAEQVRIRHRKVLFSRIS